MMKKVFSSLMALCIFGYSALLPSIVIFDSGSVSRKTPTATVKKPAAKTLATVQPPQKVNTEVGQATQETKETTTAQTATTAVAAKTSQRATSQPATTAKASGAPATSGTSAKKTVLSAKEYEMLVRIISAEAKGEPLRGQVAVGAVILNRMKSGKFPKTVTANVLKRGQFEPVANGQIWNEPVASAYKAAQLALSGWDPTYGALYFYNPAKTSSRWIRSRPTIVQIGDHVFAG